MSTFNGIPPATGPRMRLRLLSRVLLLAPALLVRPAAAQTPDPAARAPGAGGGGATVSGVVRDSLARAPLAGAIVQLVAADGREGAGRTAIADSLGRYELDDVPAGRYMLGFLHPVLDSLGVEPPLHELVVGDARAVRADLATPSPARLRAAICGPAAATDSGGGLVIGVVRDARAGAPLAGARVSVEWLELTFTTAGIGRRMPRLVATTGANGWFAVCNVPSGGTIALLASREADSTDRLELPVPAEGFLHRDLSLGAARTVVVGDTASRPDSLTLPPRRLRTGDGRLSGSVVAVDGGRPLAGAQVRIVDGPQARVNGRGEWTLTDAPAGTRMLEVRAVGYYPARRPVDVVADAAPVRVALATMKAVLDTVRITASRLAARNAAAFEERHRSGVGRFLSADDIARRGGVTTSDVFRTLPGVHMELDSSGSKGIYMRSGFRDSMGGNWCRPAFFVNGRFMGDLTADDIDGLVFPQDVVGIEVYTESQVPAQFQQALSGCGSIVIWSR